MDTASGGLDLVEICCTETSKETHEFVGIPSIILSRVLKWWANTLFVSLTTTSEGRRSWTLVYSHALQCRQGTSLFSLFPVSVRRIVFSKTGASIYTVGSF